MCFSLNQPLTSLVLFDIILTLISKIDAIRWGKTVQQTNLHVTLSMF